MKAIKGGKKNRITILKDEFVGLAGDFIKPQTDYELYMVSFNLRPWKGKVSAIMVAWDNREPIKEFIEEIIEDLKKVGKYKRRTVESVSVEYRVNRKL